MSNELTSLHLVGTFFQPLSESFDYLLEHYGW